LGRRFTNDEEHEECVWTKFSKRVYLNKFKSASCVFHPCIAKGITSTGSETTPKKNSLVVVARMQNCTVAM